MTLYDPEVLVPGIWIKPQHPFGLPRAALADEVLPLEVVVVPHHCRKDRQLVLWINNDFRFVAAAGHPPPPFLAVRSC